MSLIIAVIPSTEPILKIFDPIKLPTEIPFSFFAIATKEAASSGILVPIAQEIIQRDILWMLVFVIIIMVLSALPEKNKISKYKGIIMLIGYFVFIFQAFA